MKQIAQAIVKAQQAFSPALKSNNNPFFKSKYADLGACIEAVLDALHSNGVALIQRNHDCEHGVKVETILLHESGEEYSGGILHVPALKDDPQAYGSALTYARRYSLMATCGISPEDDDGNAAIKPKSSAPNLVKPPAPLTADEHVTACDTMKTCTDMETLKGIFGGAYKRGNEAQKKQLTEVYNTAKASLEKAA